jgi:SAM-dependent methyltransferase
MVQQALERCPACGSQRSDLRGEKNGHAVYRCRECGSLHSPRFALDYEGYYDESNLSIPEFVDQQLDHAVNPLQVYRKTNRLLDIGCGEGAFLRAARRAGWEAVGLEVSARAAAHVRSQGFDVFLGDLNTAPYPAEHFDVITAIELIEHVVSPLELLEQARRLLRPGGVLWGTTPNVQSFSSRVLGLRWSTVWPPEHLQLYSLRAVRRLMSTAGFRKVRLRTSGCNLSELWHEVRNGRPGLNSNGEAPQGLTGAPALLPDLDYDRVSSAYRLNQAMLRNPFTRGIKSTANAALWLTGLGDTIRIHAEK